MPKIYLGSLPEPIKCKSFTLTLSLNTDMNAEQLARDIKSLDQAHRAADEALKPYPGLSIGAKVESLVKNNISLECSQQTHKELSRVGIAPYAKLDVIVKELVDELLKLRQQGERNNSRLEEEDRLEIRAKLIEAIGGPANSAWSTCSLVNQIVGSLASSRSEVAELARKNIELHARLGAKGAELAELQQKHQQLHDNFKLLQHFSSGQPKGLAPKEKWGVYPIGQGSYRVMRGNEDATPHPVSKGIADAIAGELNAR
jgi:DNA repair exonuclease SbcCD ATPase subunit